MLSLKTNSEFSTLIDLLKHRAYHQADETAYIFLRDGETEETILTYQELDRQACAIAAQLCSQTLPGERALLLYPPGIEFVAAFFGCLYAGVVAVPTYPPRANRSLSRFQAVVADAQAKIALTTTSILSNVMRQFAEKTDLAALQWLTTDNVPCEAAANWQMPAINSNTLAFLQYTSGSTGLPKGVMVGHGNLLDNERTIQTAFEHTDRTIFVGWLPLFHDMGLVGNILQPLYVGIPCILMSPVAFLQRPLRWLQAISQYRATTSGGPNFAYELCVQKITPEQRAMLDLSSWSVAFNGAEPIRAATLDRFVEAFEPCGFRREAFYPCYGMAETTLLVSGNKKGRSPILQTVESEALEQNQVILADRDSADRGSVRNQTLVGCGYARLEHKVVIVNPETRKRCTTHQTGEIWVAGGSVTQGYWNQSEKTKDTFQAYLSDTEEGPFLRTGDLGFLQDGELFVTGRLKDLIIIRGRNHYPQDIELTVEKSHSALQPNSGAAFSVEVDGEEQLAILQEIDRHYQKLNLDDLIDTIRQSVAEQHELQPYSIVLLKFGSIPKTSSGKIQRHACRSGFLSNSLSVIHSWALDRDDSKSLPEIQENSETISLTSQTSSTVSIDEVQSWLVTQLSQQLKVNPDRIDIYAAFARYGLSSIQAVGLIADLETWLGRRLSPTLAYDYPSISALSQYLVGEFDLTETTPSLKLESSEPIAIVGMGCRFPGGESIEAFWQLLENGKSAIKEVPLNRWNAETFYDINPGMPGKMNTCWGGFLDRVDRFDPDFFGISPREAISMDPQQRLVLEVAWEALEQAGQAPSSLAGSSTGVFIGISNNDYSRFEFSQPSAINAYTCTGNAHSIVANRLSYFLDLRGPSLAVDTACSSSLVALHLACQSLRQGESQLGIAGGVNLILNPQLTIGFSQAHMMATDGRCKTFDADANGYVRGEGCGLVVLKRLSEAQRDGNPILAVIRGSAVNQDGLSNGLTAPNGVAQQAVIRQALDRAEATPTQISYVETHGTGTALGDPIEVNALMNAFDANRSLVNPCYIGSVKTNIGHLESAAGIAGLIKVVLALQHQKIPPHLNFQHLNPQIELAGTAFSIPTEECQPWVMDDVVQTNRRLAGVSSFSFGGTNAHVIVEEAPASVYCSSEVDRPLHLLALSAKTEEALQDLAHRYKASLSIQPNLTLANLCFSANTGRSHFSHRLVFSADSLLQLQQQIELYVADPAQVQRSIANRKVPKLAFLFTGQGSQIANMGQQLYQTQPTFRQTIDRCDAILRPYLELPLLEVLYPNRESTDLLSNETAYAQPALFALEYALSELWRSWGIVPDLVMGHSVGEYVAACIAGVFSLEDGLKLIAHRARLMQALPQNGSMAAVFAGVEQVEIAIAPYANTVTIAALNGPQNTVISGERSAVQAVLQTLAVSGIESRALNVSHAFHSPLMEPMLAEFAQIAAEIHFTIPKISLISNLTGEIITKEITHPDYWCRHIRGTVQFAASLKSLQNSAIDLGIELGAQPILIGMGRQCLPNWSGQWLPSLRKSGSNWQVLLESLATLYRQGAPVNWAGFDRDYQRQWQALPTYPFQRERYWVDAALAKPFVKVTQQSQRSLHLFQTGHSLLGEQLRLPQSSEVRFENHLSTDNLSFLADHRVYDVAVLPATGYVEIALAAAAYLGITPINLEDLSIQKSMHFSVGIDRTLQLISTPHQDRTADFKLLSTELVAEKEWVLHATGKIGRQVAQQIPEIPSLDDIQSRLQATSVELFYQQMQAQGLEYGPSFRGIQQLWRSKTEAIGRVQLPSNLEAEATTYQLHPVLLDACFQLAGAALLAGEATKTYLPIGIKKLQLYRSGTSQLWGYARIRPETDRAKSLTADLQLWDEAGLIATVEGLLLRHVPRRMLESAALSESESLNDWLYHLEWVPKPLSPEHFTASDYLQQPSAIIQTLKPQIAEWSNEVGLEVYDSLLPQMDALSFAYAVKALRDLGCDLHLQQRLSVASLARQFGVLEIHHRLLGRLLEILAEEGILEKIDAEWQICQIPVDTDPVTLQQELLRYYPACEAELSLLGNCGSRLADVLRGEVDPLQLLFPSGSLTSAEKLYQDSPAAQVVNRLVQQSITIALKNLPSDRTVRILEIGAGTGGTTSYVLPHLPKHNTQYIFSDVSTLFTLKAKEKFRDHSFVQYELLDIEQDPQAQGFDDRSFDLILAANVLHATRDLRQTLQHVKQLLAPEGMLVLLEGAGRQRWLDLIFGLTDGWWRFTDTDLRPTYPLLTPCQWVKTLQSVGFDEAVTLEEHIDRKGALSQHVVFLARSPQPHSIDRSAQSRWLVFDDGLGVGDLLSQQIRDRGASVITVLPGKTFESLGPDRFSLNPADADGFKQLLHQVVERDEQALKGVVYLWSLRTTATDRIQPASFPADRELGCMSAVYLVQALAQFRVSLPPQLWLVTQSAQTISVAETAIALNQAPLWGLGKVIALEHSELRCVRIDLPDTLNAQTHQALFDEIWTGSVEDQVALRKQDRYVARLLPYQLNPSASQLIVPMLNELAGQPCQLTISQRGTLDNLTVQPVSRRQPIAGEVEIQVHSTGLNFLDVMDALGVLPFERGWFGGECAGTVVNVGEGVTRFAVGDEVMAIAAGSFATFVTTDAQLVVHKPETLSFEQAATIPVTFLTAYYALHQVANLSAGDRVLIHAAAGGVGLAAVQLAQRAGAEIFATVGNPEKQNYLRSLGVQHLSNSRSIDFAGQVMSQTQGAGVTIVLNSLAGEFIPQSLRIMANQGHFLEIGKTNIWPETQVRELNPTLTYSVLDLVELCRVNPALIQSMFVELMNAFQQGQLTPLPCHVFPLVKVASAFRYMAHAKHIGKVVVNQPIEAQIVDSSISIPSVLPIQAEASYLITGGLNGLGLLVSEWLVKQGVQHLVLMGRSQPTEEVCATIRTLEQSGVQILIAQANVAEAEQVATVLAKIEESMPPLRGVIHSAGVLNDGVLIQQNAARFGEVMAPKVEGAWNLHQLTQHQPLDFFVCFSSVAALLGSPGQANHAAANTFLDALVHHRRLQGLPGLSINWGAWSNIGAAAKRNVGNRITAQGMGTIAPEQGLKILAQLLQQDIAQVGVLPVQWPKFLQQFPTNRIPAFLMEVTQTNPKLANSAEIVSSSPLLSDFRQHLEVVPESDRSRLLVAHIREQMAIVLNHRSPERIDSHCGFFDLGMDSLTAIELKSRLAASLAQPLPSTLIFEYPTIDALANYLAQDLFAKVPSPTLSEPSQPQNNHQGNNQTNHQTLIDTVEKLSESEVEALLMNQLEVLL